jgi:cytoplasmic tRNA 2-thiolation protein 1
LPRVKPFKYTYEKEIVMYAYYKKLDFFSTECVYAPYAARGTAREFVKDLELVRPIAILDLIKSAETFRYPEGMQACEWLLAPESITCSLPGSSASVPFTFTSQVIAAETEDNTPRPGKCRRCGYISSQHVCKACLLLEGLNTGNYRLGVARSKTAAAVGQLPAHESPAVERMQQQVGGALDHAILADSGLVQGVGVQHCGGEGCQAETCT